MKTIFKEIEKNNLKGVKNEIAKGVSVNEIDEYGYSPLLFASYKNSIEIAILLINSGADVNFKDKNGQTILHYAALNNQYEVAKLALIKGADISIEDVHGNQALWTAVFNDKGKNSRINIIKLFLDYKADINHLNKVNKSPKDITKIAGYKNLYDLLGVV